MAVDGWCCVNGFSLFEIAFVIYIRTGHLFMLVYACRSGVLISYVDLCQQSEWTTNVKLL